MYYLFLPLFKHDTYVATGYKMFSNRAVVDA